MQVFYFEIIHSFITQRLFCLNKV